MDIYAAVRPIRPATAIVTSAQSSLCGRIRLPGDKSVSIRRALLTLFSENDIRLEHYGSGEDCLTALCCLRQLGKEVTRNGEDVNIAGKYLEKSATLDCRNSGTTARLLMGLLCGLDGEWEIAGDESLSTRPMERVAQPLREMGAVIELTDGKLPARISGSKLRPIRYESPVASAQVKSAVLLAGISGGVEVEYKEPYPSRNHTEKLLGVSCDTDGWIRLPKNTAAPSSAALSGNIPGDPSSAAFWGIAATLIPESKLIIEDVLIDPMRCGWIDVLRSAGTDIRIGNEKSICAESVGDVVCSASIPKPLLIPQEIVPRVIDEIPVLAVAATQTNGLSRIEGVNELRIKESDRLQQLVQHLSAMNAKTEIKGDELLVHGSSQLEGAEVEPRADHRIAMAFAIAGLIASGKTKIHSADSARISYPEFWKDLSVLSPGSLTYEN